MDNLFPWHAMGSRPTAASVFGAAVLNALHLAAYAAVVTAVVKAVS